MILDLILLALLALAALNGWRRGAIAMVLAVVVLFAAAIGATIMAISIGHVLAIGPEWLRPIIGWMFVFLVLMIAGNWVKHFFRPKHGVLRGLDGIAGAVLGFIRGLILLSLFLAMFKLVHLPPEKWTKRSTMYDVLLNASGQVMGVVKPYV